MRTDALQPHPKTAEGQTPADTGQRAIDGVAGQSDPLRKLARRAALASANGILTQGVQFIIGFAVTPFVARTLGQTDFGLWTLLWQTNNYLSLGQFRVANMLKLRLAVGQGRLTPDEKRRLATATLWLVCLFLIPISALSVLAATQVDRFFHLGPSSAGIAACALILVSGALAVNQFGGIAGAILRGENVEYAFAGIPAVTMLSITGFSVLFLFLGYGIVGLGCAHLLGQTLGALLTWSAARRAVNWIGFGRTSGAEVLAQAKDSLWSMVSTTSQMVLSNFDLMLVGILFGSATAAEYYVAGALTRFLQLPVATAIGVVGSGMAGLFGSGNLDRLARANHEFAVLALTASGVTGALIIGLNSGFTTLWMGPEYHASMGLTAGILVGGVSLLFVNSAMNLYDAALEFKYRTLYIWLGIAVGIASGIVLGARLGIAGFALGQFFGRAVTLLGLSLHLTRKYQVKPAFPLRPLLVNVTLWAALLPLNLSVASWTEFFLKGIVLAATAMVVNYFLGLHREDRATVRNRVRQLLAAVFAYRLPPPGSKSPDSLSRPLNKDPR